MKSIDHENSTNGGGRGGADAGQTGLLSSPRSPALVVACEYIDDNHGGGDDDGDGDAGQIGLLVNVMNMLMMMTQARSACSSI